jgi:hypothetical protein
MRTVLDTVSLCILALALVLVTITPAQSACSVGCAQWGKGSLVPPWFAPGQAPNTLVCLTDISSTYAYLPACALSTAGNVVVQGQPQTVQKLSGCAFICPLQRDCQNMATIPTDAVMGTPLVKTMETDGTCQTRS